jgi:acetyl-CoA carboxylase biotin carboxylase subunit
MVSYAALPAGDGVRFDSHIQAGTAVPPFYDSLLGKIIARGTDRADALRRMRNALKVCEIGGVNTNLPIHSALLETEEYERGAVDTGFLQRFLEGHAIHAA